jgi:hypothetical protein
LKPGAELDSEIVLAFDLEARELVLKTPGMYEFEIVQRVGPDVSIRSNPVVVQVTAAPSGERAVLAECSRVDLALLAQFDPVTSDDVEAQTVRDAANLIERHPSSRYAKAIRRGLNRALGSRVLESRATREERELYERLKDDSSAYTPSRK